MKKTLFLLCCTIIFVFYSCGTINGYEYIDLDLPSGTKWATCNVGANAPEEYGEYYAWGETNTKYTYISGNSKTYYDDLSDISGIPYHDVARAKWGDSWRIPTKEEMNELRYYCDWTWTNQNGINGYKITGKNGNSIFLPAAGICTNTFCSFSGGGGFYWTATPKGLADAYSLNFHHKEHNLSSVYSRYNGLCIRPVSD